MDSQLGPCLSGVCPGVDDSNRDGFRIRAQQSFDRAQGTGLASSVRPKEPKDLPLPNFRSKVVDCHGLTVRHAQALDSKSQGGGGVKLVHSRCDSCAPARRPTIDHICASVRTTDTLRGELVHAPDDNGLLSRPRSLYFCNLGGGSPEPQGMPREVRAKGARPLAGMGRTRSEKLAVRLVRRLPEGAVIGAQYAILLI